MKISVAVPVYDSRLLIQVVQSIMSEQLMSVLDGDTIQFSFVGGNAGIVQARNEMAYRFMRSDFDRLVMLDADVSFEPGALLKLAHHEADVVAGVYRFKMDGPENYPMRFLPDPDKRGIPLRRDGLIEVEAAPTGFLAISRVALQKFEDAFPERLKMHFGQETFSYFQMPINDGIIFGEDYWFCKEWRDLGGSVFVDPEIPLTHWSTSPVAYAGHVGNWIKSKNTPQSISKPQEGGTDEQSLAV
ncbi:MAG: hypothetical protein V4568_14655 [Pseudomonadota bacterium]